MEPGHFALLGQFLDFTKCRPTTFFDGDDERVVHIDLTHPYCPRLAGRLLRAGELLKEHLYRDVVYACTEGPRFETAAEINALRLLGADVVGMTECAGSRPRPRSRSLLRRRQHHLQLGRRDERSPPHPPGSARHHGRSAPRPCANSSRASSTAKMKAPAPARHWDSRTICGPSPNRDAGFEMRDFGDVRWKEAGRVRRERPSVAFRFTITHEDMREAERHGGNVPYGCDRLLPCPSIIRHPRDFRFR